MIPWIHIDTADIPGGEGTLRLKRRGAEFSIMLGDNELMNSRLSGSEQALATLCCERLPDRPAARFLIGGLGMGSTLRAALERLGPEAEVVVAELVPGVVEWNRGALGECAGRPLKDRRVDVVVGDVLDTLAASREAFDAVLLDVDNGPDAFTSASNAALYGDRGLAVIRASLRPGGVVAVWSAWEDRKFEQRLRAAGYSVRVERVRARLKKGGPWHTIFLGTPSGSPVGRARERH